MATGPPGPRWGSLQRSPRSLAGLRGPTFKERGGEGKERGREGREIKREVRERQERGR